MKWTYDLFFARAYFLGGCAIGLWGLLSLAFNVPVPEVPNSKGFVILLLGGLLIMIGTNFRRDATVLEKKPE